MFKKNSFLLLALIIAFSLFLSACASNTEPQASEEENNRTDAKATIYYFWGEGCPFCTIQREFLDEMEDKYPDLEVKSFETYRNRQNAQMLQNMAQAYGVRASGVPMTFIGDFDPLVGFSDSMGKSLEEMIIYCLEEDCPDPGDKIQ